MLSYYKAMLSWVEFVKVYPTSRLCLHPCWEQTQEPGLQKRGIQEMWDVLELVKRLVNKSKKKEGVGGGGVGLERETEKGDPNLKVPKAKCSGNPKIKV